MQGDASLTAAAKWANLAAASLSLKSFGAATAASPTGPSPPPPLISTSAFLPELNQPLSLRELAAAQPLLLSKKKGASDRAAVAEAAAAAAAAKAAKAQTPLRLKVSLRPDPSRTGACFSGARRAGGSLSASKGGLSAGAVEASVGALVEFHVQVSSSRCRNRCADPNAWEAALCSKPRRTHAGTLPSAPGCCTL